MAAQAALQVVVEIGPHRSADNIGACVLRGAQHRLQPFRRGDFVVVDHQQAVGVGKCRQRGFERGIDRVAIALARLDHAEPGKFARRQEIRSRPERFRIPMASFSTITTAKRRPVCWATSDSSVSRRCCGRRKAGNTDHGLDRRVERGRHRRPRARAVRKSVETFRCRALVEVSVMSALTWFLSTPQGRTASRKEDHVPKRDRNNDTATMLAISGPSCARGDAKCSGTVNATGLAEADTAGVQRRRENSFLNSFWEFGKLVVVDLRRPHSVHVEIRRIGDIGLVAARTSRASAE